LSHVNARRNEAVFAYFRKAVLNRIRDEIRRPHRMEPLSDQALDEPDPGASPIEQAMGREAVEQFEAAFVQLSATDRDCIMARIELNLPYQDIADLMGKPSADAARIAVGRALARLAKKMPA